LHRVESECINSPPIIHKSHATKVTIQTSWHSENQAKVKYQLKCTFNSTMECFYFKRFHRRAVSFPTCSTEWIYT